MSKRFEFVLDKSAFRNQVLKSEEMQKGLSEFAQGIVSNLGAGHMVSSQKGKNRANVRIEAVTDEAIQNNYENNTLLKAIGVGK